MKNKNLACSVLLSIVFIVACNSRLTKTEAAQSGTSEALPNPVPLIDLKLVDKDPYFAESKDTTSSHGPSDITRNIIQDKNDNLWFASWNGIVRYDGEVFTNFTNLEGLRRYHTFSALADKKGNLWFGSIGAGVYRFDGMRFKNFTTKDGLSDNKVECIYEDESGLIWFGADNGVTYYDGMAFVSFTEKDGLSGLDVHSITQDRTGKIWVSSTDGVCFLDGQGFHQFTNTDGKPFVNIRCILEDKVGNLWLGGQEGLFKYDGMTIKTISTDFIGFLYEDSKGVLWMSASSGDANRNMALNRYLPSTKNPKIERVLVAEGQVFGIMEARDGALWFGHERGVCRYDGQKFTYF